MASLPLDLLLDVAVYLDSADLLNASIVSKTWNQIITATPQLWQHPQFTIRRHSERRRYPPTLEIKPDPKVIAQKLLAGPALSLQVTRQLGAGYDRSLQRLLFMWLRAFPLASPSHLVLHGITAHDLA